jgi:hypothetical protein
MDHRAQVIGDDGAPEIGIVAGIGHDVTDTLEAGQQHICLRTIAPLLEYGIDADRQANRIKGCMQLGRQATTGLPDRGSHSRPFASAASAWTLGRVLSIRT